MNEPTAVYDSVIGQRMKRILSVIAVVIFVVVAFLIVRELKTFRYEELRDALRMIPGRSVVAALALTGLTYMSLTLYDRAALIALGHVLPYRRIAFSSFLSYAFSYNLGSLGGAAMRTRIYAVWGLTPIEIARILWYNVLSYWLGFLTIAGLAFVIEPLLLPVGSYDLSSRIIGVVFLGLIASYFWLTARSKQSLRVMGHEFSLPSHRASIIQVSLAALEWLCTVSVLYALLKTGIPVPFSHFLTMFLFAQVAGVVSNVPGGLGVFEFVLWELLPGGGTPALVAGLVVFRSVFYLVPLLVGIAAFVAHELRNRLRLQRKRMTPSATASHPANSH